MGPHDSSPTRPSRLRLVRSDRVQIRRRYEECDPVELDMLHRVISSDYVERRQMPGFRGAGTYLDYLCELIGSSETLFVFDDDGSEVDVTIDGGPTLRVFERFLNYWPTSRRVRHANEFFQFASCAAYLLGMKETAESDRRLRALLSIYEQRYIQTSDQTELDLLHRSGRRLEGIFRGPSWARNRANSLISFRAVAGSPVLLTHLIFVSFGSRHPKDQSLHQKPLLDDDIEVIRYSGVTVPMFDIRFGPEFVCHLRSRTQPGAPFDFSIGIAPHLTDYEEGQLETEPDDPNAVWEIHYSPDEGATVYDAAALERVMRRIPPRLLQTSMGARLLFPTMITTGYPHLDSDVGTFVKKEAQQRIQSGAFSLDDVENRMKRELNAASERQHLAFSDAKIEHFCSFFQYRVLDKQIFVRDDRIHQYWANKFDYFGSNI